MLVLFLLVIILFTAAAVFLLIGVVSYSTGSGVSDTRYYVVKEVVDGDTIVLEDGTKIRYVGIDTPELHHPEIGEECGGKDARQENIRLLSGKKVRLIKDVTDRDEYGRLLRYVFTEDGVFINYELARSGYAQVFDVPPDRLFTYTFTKAQIEAKKEGRGLWTKCYNITRATQ